MVTTEDLEDFKLKTRVTSLLGALGVVTITNFKEIQEYRQIKEFGPTHYSKRA